MPSPVRLATRLTFRNADLTLDPPAPSDQLLTTPARAWTATGPKTSLDHYRLILARLSASTPAQQNPDGSLTPWYHNMLAWVVYSQSNSPAIQGCGDSFLSIVDANTGRWIEGVSTASGP
jgi:hypothetical protein